MLGLLLDRPRTEPLRVLLLGAHCDDIEIGCGGTILELAARYPELSVHWVVLSSNDERAPEAEACARRFLAGAGRSEVRVERFRDGYFPYDGGPIKDYFESLKSAEPHVIFTHYRNDWHQDHRLVCELTWNTWRDHLILEYEVPKYDPDVGSPNLFVHVSETNAEAKIGHLMECYPSQTKRRWFTPDTFLGSMRLRGIECGAPRFAEGFYCRKMVLAAP